jgi:hypothetical protein
MRVFQMICVVPMSARAVDLVDARGVWKLPVISL